MYQPSAWMHGPTTSVCSDIEARFVCEACGKRGADVRRISTGAANRRYR
jgi:hypothetical protein